MGFGIFMLIMDFWEKRRHDRNDWSNSLWDTNDSPDWVHFSNRTCA